MDAQWDRPLTIATLALGGQGGGVLSSWLVEVAEASGYLVQSTYVAGVAQRTGATVYCVEMFPQNVAEAAGQSPVFTSYPIPGDVDVVIAGEMAEVGRAIEKGFVTPNSSTLIASTHRVYTMPEKTALGNGIIDMSAVDKIAMQAARKYIRFDMQCAAEETGSIISAVLLGAVAGSGALPFEREAYVDIIRKTGRAVDANLAGFHAGFEQATAGRPLPEGVVVEEPVAEGTNGSALLQRIVAELPKALHTMTGLGALRALDYQDRAYADLYIDRVVACAEEDPDPARLTLEVARQLALQMCYEDTIRVADLKTRKARTERVRQHVAAAADQPAHIIEYFHPRIEEVIDTLPKNVGDWLHDSPKLKKMLQPFFRKGRNIRTSGVFGFSMLHMLAKMRRIRRSTRRYHLQQEFVETWLQSIRDKIDSDYELALAIASSIEVVRGYGDTYERGYTRYTRAVAASNNAEQLAALHSAAKADEQGRVFEEALAGIEGKG